VNSTPRVLNRMTLLISGLLLMLDGAHWMLSAALPDYRGKALQLARSLGLDELHSSGLTFLGIALLLIVLYLIGCLGLQGRGRVAVYRRVADAHSEPPGVIEVAGGAVDQAVRSMLASHREIASVGVSIWEQPGTPGLRIKVQPRKGAPPGPLARDVLKAVRVLQRRLGSEGPVLVHVVTGTRSRFGREDRVH